MWETLFAKPKQCIDIYLLLFRHFKNRWTQMQSYKIDMTKTYSYAHRSTLHSLVNKFYSIVCICTSHLHIRVYWYTHIFYCYLNRSNVSVCVPTMYSFSSSSILQLCDLVGQQIDGNQDMLILDHWLNWRWKLTDQWGTK